jgi:sulfonate transport system permease protein
VRSLALLRGLGGVLSFLLLWEVAVRTGAFHLESIPTPSEIAAALPGLATEELFGEVAHTVNAALVAWGLAAVFGVFFGAALGLFATLRAYTMATVEVLRPLPPVALVPVALLLFGFSIETELFVTTISAVWPILVGTMGGVLAVSPQLKDVARSLRLRPWEVLCKVLIPAAAPSVLVGCRLSMTISLVLAIVVEMIGNPQGLGYAVVREAQALDRPAMFAYVFIIGLLGVIFNVALVVVSKILLPGEFKRPQTAAMGA